MDTKLWTRKGGHGRRPWTRTRRLVVLVLGVSGLLLLFTQAAQAFMSQQHCEPTLRR
jgi:hypothetical protein